MVSIYERIAQLCAQRGIKGGKMCDDLGLSRSTMTELRKGRAATLKLPKAKLIADYFGVSVDELLGVSAVGSAQVDDFTYALFGEAQRLSEDNKQKLLEMARFFNEQQAKQEK